MTAASPASPDPLADLDPHTRRSIADALWQQDLDVSAIPADALTRLAGDLNSSAAYGKRMQAFLSYLLEHPVEHTPSFDDNYRHLLPFCETLSPQAAYAITTNLLGPAAQVGYDMVPTKANFQFPRDFGPKQRSAVSLALLRRQLLGRRRRRVRRRAHVLPGRPPATAVRGRLRPDG